MKRHPQRAVHRPDQRVCLTVPATGETLDGPLLACLNAATPALDAGYTLIIDPVEAR